MASRISPSSLDLRSVRTNLMDSAFSCFSFEFLIMFSPSFGAVAETFLDGSGSGSEQNVRAAPAPAKICRLRRLQLRLRLRIHESLTLRLPWRSGAYTGDITQADTGRDYSCMFLARQATGPLIATSLLTPATLGYCGAVAWPREYPPPALTWGQSERIWWILRFHVSVLSFLLCFPPLSEP